EQLSFFRTTFPSGVTLFQVHYNDLTRRAASPYMRRVRGGMWKRAVLGAVRRSGVLDKAEEDGMEAISVKRQRKLKMKKHKYKKLMKKTRNLRRRLEKQ